MLSSDAAPPASPSARRLADEHGIDLASVKGTGPGGRITKGDVEAAAASKDSGGSPSEPVKADIAQPLVSPSASRLAKERGIDLAKVQGSGPKGRILKSDVEAFDPNASPLETGLSPEPRAAPPSPSQSEVGAADAISHEAPFETQTLSNIRKVVARRLTEAKQTIPHFYLSADVRLDALLDLRSQINASNAAEGTKISVNDMLIKALAHALKRVPSCNVSFQENALLQYLREDISVAVAGPAGLITPIIKDAGRKKLIEISTEMKALAAKARDGKLQPHEYQGGTASISNLGMYKVSQFNAVINPPQGMILAIGAGEKRPMVDGGELKVGSAMTITGSFDHRAIDGATGAELIGAFKDCIESPFSLLA